MDSSPQMENEGAEDCTSTSIYLSCKEDSTTSSLPFPTLEDSQSDLNKMLEPVNQLPIKTGKDVDIANRCNRALSSPNTEDKENVFPEIGDGSSTSLSADKGMKYKKLTGEGLKDDGKKLEVNASPLDLINATNDNLLVKKLVVDAKVKSEPDKMKPTAVIRNAYLPTKKFAKKLPSGQKYKKKVKILDKQDVTLDPEVEVGHLVEKMSQISVRLQRKTATTGSFKKINKKSPIPSKAGEKRRVSFSQHMSIVMKTTLNTVARKSARKRVLGAATQQQQRIIIRSTKSGEVKQFAKNVGTTRKNMLPRAANATDKAPAAQIFPSKKPKLSKLESLKHSKVGDMSDSKTAPANTKPEGKFVCKTCNQRFRVKSLLAAHKRLHELDTNPPKCIKRFGSENKCEYCDKKFALLGTLTMHLLRYCEKIPLLEKRKLHVFLSKQHSDASSSNATPSASCTFNIGHRTFRSPIRPTPDKKNVIKKMKIKKM
uniref:C2H2-type domain-containing protein n=1 Tax=Glossina palpalis gambiensis TaxID=67801 RepID=A0A1B0AQK0_9MUSC